MTPQPKGTKGKVRIEGITLYEEDGELLKDAMYPSEAVPEFLAGVIAGENYDENGDKIVETPAKP